MQIYLSRRTSVLLLFQESFKFQVISMKLCYHRILYLMSECVQQGSDIEVMNIKSQNSLIQQALTVRLDGLYLPQLLRPTIPQGWMDSGRLPCKTTLRDGFERTTYDLGSKRADTYATWIPHSDYGIQKKFVHQSFRLPLQSKTLTFSSAIASQVYKLQL